jgi:hypothetical protein
MQSEFDCQALPFLIIVDPIVALSIVVQEPIYIIFYNYIPYLGYFLNVPSGFGAKPSPQ